MKSDAITIEPMARRDIDTVRAIDELVYGNPWSAATWRSELGAADRFHLIARSGPEIVGHSGLLFVLDEVHVTTVAVHPDQQGLGLGTRLTLALLDEARRHGSVAATLEVRATQRRTQRVYSRLGFVPVGTRKAYYSKPVDDAIVMWLHDLQGAEAEQRLERVRDELERVQA